VNCFECAVRGTAVAAVATCPNCGAGLCLGHLADAQANRVGGTLFGCSHDLRQAIAPLHASTEGVAAPGRRDRPPVRAVG
jgi:hypothetical protein